MASEYYVVSFDDHQGNLGRENELIDFLKKNLIPSLITGTK